MIGFNAQAFLTAFHAKAVAHLGFDPDAIGANIYSISADVWNGKGIAGNHGIHIYVNVPGNTVLSFLAHWGMDHTGAIFTESYSVHTEGSGKCIHVTMQEWEAQIRALIEAVRVAKELKDAEAARVREQALAIGAGKGSEVEW